MATQMSPKFYFAKTVLYYRLRETEFFCSIGSIFEIVCLKQTVQPVELITNRSSNLTSSPLATKLSYSF